MRPPSFTHVVHGRVCASTRIQCPADLTEVMLRQWCERSRVAVNTDEASAWLAQLLLASCCVAQSSTGPGPGAWGPLFSKHLPPHQLADIFSSLGVKLHPHFLFLGKVTFVTTHSFPGENNTLSDPWEVSRD